MRSTHLVIKCPNCGRWQFYCGDSECECGVLLFEAGDILASPQTSGEVRQLDLSRIDTEALTQPPPWRR